MASMIRYRYKRKSKIDTHLHCTPSNMNFQTMLMPILIWAKYLSQKNLVRWNHSNINYALKLSLSNMLNLALQNSSALD